MAHDVLVAEADERDAVDLVEDVLHLDQARGLVARQVDLRDVAGDDHLRAEAEPRQEHLHLLRRGVLRLVEDDEAVVERVVRDEEVVGDVQRVGRSDWMQTVSASPAGSIESMNRIGRPPPCRR